MPKKSTKSKSKRVSLHQKYKIIKKVKEHKKKQAKALKKKGGKVKPPKDPGIPAAWPFKEQLMQEIEFAHQKDVRRPLEKPDASPAHAPRSGKCRRAAAHLRRRRRRRQEEAKAARKEAARLRRASAPPP